MKVFSFFSFFLKKPRLCRQQKSSRSQCAQIQKVIVLAAAAAAEGAHVYIRSRHFKFKLRFLILWARRFGFDLLSSTVRLPPDDQHSMIIASGAAQPSLTCWIIPVNRFDWLSFVASATDVAIAAEARAQTVIQLTRVWFSHSASPKLSSTFARSSSARLPDSVQFVSTCCPVQLSLARRLCSSAFVCSHISGGSARQPASLDR